MKQKSWCRGSFTVEAAFVVPFGFLVLLSLSCLFQSLIQQNDTQLAMLQSVKSYSIQGEHVTSLEKLAQNKIILHWKETKDDHLCYVNCVLEIPFLGSRMFKINRYQQMVVNDYSGVSMIPEQAEDQMVYVAVNGKVYHLDRECTYLRTRIHATTVNQMWDLRNQSGGIYYPCEDCCRAKEQEGNTSVYFTSYGNRYHISRNCSKIRRTVKKVHRSEVGNLTACSKCGGS